MARSQQFQLPEDPSPMPTMGSDDEESFVLLCNSYAPELDLSFKDLHIEPVQSGPIEEGKELITMELSQLENSRLPQMPDVTQQIMSDTDPQISITSISTELSPEEIQIKVNTVIAENIKLKDTIIANNAAMEAQYKRVMAWKEEVYKTYQAHKMKFAEAKDFITKLKSEKNILSFELEKSKEIREMEQTELLNLKADLARKGSLQKSDTIVSTTREVCVGFDTQKEMSDLKSKLEEYEKLLKLADSTKNGLIAENEELKMNLVTEYSLDETITELNKEVQEKNKIIKMLEETLEQREGSFASNMEIRNTEIINLKSQLCLTINLQEDLDNLRKQLMASQATITALQQINSVLAAQLSAEQKKVEELTKLESIKDDYFALQQQLEIYKADFNAEKEAKNALKSEKEQIINDFRQLQKRNSELNEELEVMRDSGFVLTARELSHQQSSSNTSSTRPQEKRFSCPVCHFGFTGIEALENHVERCIDLDMLP